MIRCDRGPSGEPCGRAAKGGPILPGDCPRCYAAINRELLVEIHRASVANRKTVRIGLPIIRPYRCIHLGKRTEFRPGCAGLKCEHDCRIGYTAVPAKQCQRCESYVEDPEEPWIG